MSSAVLGSVGARRSARVLAVVGAAFLSSIVHAQDPNAPLLERSLFADRKATRVGDLLTVVITEVATATTTARTSTDKEDRIAGDIHQPDERPWHLDLGFSNDFSGGGQVQRTGRLLGKLAVRVESVDTNGNLTIYGEQDIAVNNERQRIGLRGSVRSDDVAPDNTVPSWRIADAKIEFKGDGILARKQSPGLLSKIFDLFGLN
jgi:flagellar L-ring protein precursor FlgH